MLHRILILLSFIISASAYSQKGKVIISEKKQGKRVVLMAENKTKDTLNVFFMVTSEGYRRSATKPVIKDIPPLSIVSMITLIELSNVPSSYSYELIVNNQKNNLNASFEKQAVNISEAFNGKLVLFVKNNCQKCADLESELKNKGVSYQSFDLNQDTVLYRQFMAFISKELTAETRIRFPLIWNKDHTIFGYDNIEEVIKNLID